MHLERHEIKGRGRLHLCGRWEDALTVVDGTADVVRPRGRVEVVVQFTADIAVDSSADGSVWVAIRHRCVAGNVGHDVNVIGELCVRRSRPRQPQRQPRHP